jgi:hypothetical protein
MYNIKEVRRAILSVLYHDTRSSVDMVKDFFGSVPDSIPPVPTEEQREIARGTVERLLWIRYDNLTRDGFVGQFPFFRTGLLDEFRDPSLVL